LKVLEYKSDDLLVLFYMGNEVNNCIIIKRRNLNESWEDPRPR